MEKDRLLLSKNEECIIDSAHKAEVPLKRNEYTILNKTKACSACYQVCQENKTQFWLFPSHATLSTSSR